MKNFLLFSFLPIALFISSYSYGQQIDPSIISQLSPEQIERAKEAYSGLNSTDTEIQEMPVIDESLQDLVISDSNDIANKKFGYSFFSTIPTSTSAVGDLPLPNDYKISIRDQFTVILSGSKESIFDLNVKLDGTILFPEIGSISVVGETFGAVKEKLSNIVNQSYIGVQIDLSIKNLSAKKITIVGAVKTPGTYLVNPFSTISSALAYSGGISEIGTLRDIKLIRNSGETFTFDLYNLLINADRSDDITIEAGDTILINAASQFINLIGSVNRPGIYEVKESENLGDLIRYGLGFQQTSNKSKISISKLDLKNKRLSQAETDDLLISLLDVTSVSVFDYLNEDNANIYVSGAVTEPGYYDLEEFSTLLDLIDALQFVDVYPWLGVLEQFNKKDYITETILFSLEDSSSYESIKILPNSRVYFTNLIDRDFSQTSDLSRQAINDFSLVINYKNRAISMPIYGNYSLKSIIDFIGLDMSDVSREATYVSPLENLIEIKDYAEMEFEAAKYNTVTFKSLARDLINVNISGAIEFPGTYTLNSNSNLNDLYKIIGGFKSSAFKDGIVFKRELIKKRQLSSIDNAKKSLNDAIIANMQRNDSTPIDPNLISAMNVSIDEENLGRISGDFSPDNLANKDLILYDGDVIFVPKKLNSVSVLGEVLNPNSFIYDSKISITEAIAYSGGYREFANKKGVYVIRANGLVVEAANRNIFANIQTLQPGDTVIVPRKLRLNDPLSQTIAPITQVLSDLAFSAAAIDNLSNN